MTTSLTVNVRRILTPVIVIARAAGRFAGFLFVLHAVLFGIFSILPSTAGGLLGWAAYDREAAEQINRDLGLDGPWYARYASHLSAAARGDLGVSTRGRFEITHILLVSLRESLPLFATAVIACVAGFFAAVVLGIPVRSVPTRRVLRILTSAALLPPFVAGLLAAVAYESWVTKGYAVSLNRVVYWVCLIGSTGAFPMALAFSSTLMSAEQIAPSDFIRTHRALGAGWGAVRTRASLNLLHAVRPQMGQIVIGSLLSTGFVELLFGLPGFGRAGFLAFQSGDFPLMFGWMIAAGGLAYGVTLLTRWTQ